MKMRSISLISLICLITLSAAAQDDPKTSPVLFKSDDILDITLRFDLSSYRRQRSDTTEYDAILTWHKNEKDSVKIDVKLRARGNLRRQICDMPPMRINFPKSGTAGTPFDHLDKIKVVTHCKSPYSESVLREFLVYKLYNVLTDYSYRVRLARITYINNNRNNRPQQEYAFFIEPTEDLCKRTRSFEITAVRISQKAVRSDMMDRMAIFNYMIGNTDWSVPIRHNIVFLSQQDYSKSGTGLIIPYDFDQAGIVGAAYAAPFEGLGLKSVFERRYLGVCRSREDFIHALAEFSDKKDELYETINNFPYLRDQVKKIMTNYLNSFYSGINKQYSVVNKFMNECIEF